MKFWKPSLVILHGWGLSSKFFTPLVKEFRQRKYRVLAPDLPGFGESDLPSRPLKLADYVDFLKNYLKKQNVSNVILIGHSFGGRIALKYQERYPQNVKALILTGTPGFTPIPKKRLAFFILMAKLGRVLFMIPPLNYFESSVRRWYYYVAGAKDYFRAEGPMRQTFKNIVQEELISAMEAVTCPCLLLWGELDIVVPVSIAQRMRDAISTAKLIVIPEADHGLPFKQPAVFATYSQRFLESL